jgi:hypothetical protein
MAVANTLSNYYGATIAAVKSLMIQAPVSSQTWYRFYEISFKETGIMES